MSYRGPRISRINFEGAPDSIPRISPEAIRLERTVGDGGCAIHSVFGTSSPRGYFHARARDFIRECFGETSQGFRTRLNDVQLGRELEQVLWVELVKPMAINDAGLSGDDVDVQHESRIVWQEVARDQPLLASCVDAAVEQEASYAAFMARRQEAVTAFGETCVEPLKEVFVRPLLESLDLLDNYCSNQCSLGCSKFEALFRRSPESRLYQQSVIEHCGVSNFQTLLGKVQDIVGGMVEWVGQNERIYAFTAVMVETYRVCPSANAEPFPDFFDRAYGAYLAAMTRADYFLSDLELLALSHCARMNVVIFRHCLDTHTP
jgi:hypothetical protein